LKKEVEEEMEEEEREEEVERKLGTEAHTYNPSYLGGRDLEDQGSSPALV
jgi:hypothetical protein